MLIEDVKEHFGTCYAFHKQTGMHHSCYLNWSQKGFIPIKTQIKLEQMTSGKLLASLAHLGDES
jgi:hypothetical protein